MLVITQLAIGIGLGIVLGVGAIAALTLNKTVLNWYIKRVIETTTIMAEEYVEEIEKREEEA